MTSNTIYEIKCSTDNCKEIYNGETYRPLHERFIEHYRNANNPTAPSYTQKPMAKHFHTTHPNSTPKLSINVLEKAHNTINRKIREARVIAKNKPSINDRRELSDLQQFLI